MHELAVTAVGTDRPGIVAAVARVLHERGGNLEDSAMTILGGHLAIVLLVATEDDPETLRAALAAATADLGLTISVSRAYAERHQTRPTHLLSVCGRRASARRDPRGGVRVARRRPHPADDRRGDLLGGGP